MFRVAKFLFWNHFTCVGLPVCLSGRLIYGLGKCPKIYKPNSYSTVSYRMCTKHMQCCKGLAYNEWFQRWALKLADLALGIDVAPLLSFWHQPSYKQTYWIAGSANRSPSTFTFWCILSFCRFSRQSKQNRNYWGNREDEFIRGHVPRCFEWNVEWNLEWNLECLHQRSFRSIVSRDSYHWICLWGTYSRVRVRL